jgi:hypothetical protein
LAKSSLGQAKNCGAEKRQDKKARLHKIDLQQQKLVFSGEKRAVPGDVPAIGFNFLSFGLPRAGIYTRKKVLYPLHGGFA